MFLSFIIVCAVMVSCGVLSSIHLDLGCTHTRGSDPCLSTIDRQSPVLYHVQCGSFNHALAHLKRWIGCGTHVV